MSVVWSRGGRSRRSSGVLCPLIQFALVLIVILLGSHPVAGQESRPLAQNLSPDRDGGLSAPFEDVRTSLGRPLQQQLEERYPESFRAGVDIFWEAGEGWVSPEVLDWWTFRVDPVGLTPERAGTLFSQISGRASVFPGPGQRMTCAVVGASRNLLGSGYGGRIDSHDLVFRVNRAPIEDFRSDVGQKTTHHVAWPTDLGENQADRRAYLLLNPMTLHSPNLFDRILSLVEIDLAWDKERVRLIHPEFVKYLHQNWMEARGAFPSTGFIALMIAVHVCDEVDVFGFGADAMGRWDRYYEDDPVVVTDLHPADFEGEFRRELDTKGIVKVFLGNRSAFGVKFFRPRTDGTQPDS